MDVVQILLLNLVIAGVLFLGLWLVNLAVGDPSFVDGWWPLGMVTICWATFLELGQGNARAILLTTLCTAWGLRLGVYLLWRWRKHGPDRRYVSLIGDVRKARGWSYAKASLLLVFVPQWLLQFIVCLPAQLGQLGETAMPGVVAWIGAALAMIGILFESIGDFQLAAFAADPANTGKVLQSGLWRYTRHPNYFGEACLWWGLWLIAADAGFGLWSMPGPVLITVLLTRGSGVPTVEGAIRDRRPDYDAYVRRTSGFIPWPPKRGPAGGGP